MPGKCAVDCRGYFPRMLRTVAAVLLVASNALAQAPSARERWNAVVDEMQRWRDTEWPEEALRSVAKNLLRNHLSHCANHAMHGDKAQQAAMVDELVALVGKIAR